MHDAPPVFIVGSARSGTTLLYHTLLSTGSYAVYRGEPAVFDLVQPRYGDLRRRSARRRALQEWPRSHFARACGLDSTEACGALLESVESTGDFLRRAMTILAARQGVSRWAVWGPDNLLLMPWIKRELPDARFIHMVRDGRDVALSIGAEGWIRPLPWDRGREVLVAALHWQWKLRRGRADSRSLGPDYLELAFEDLVTRRDATLERVGRFLGHPIDVDRIEREPVGTLRDPNSTFRREGSAPVGRWRERMKSADLREVERAIGQTLVDFGYELRERDYASTPTPESMLYALWFGAKHTLRTSTMLGRFVDAGRLRLAPIGAPAEEPSSSSPGQHSPDGALGGAHR